MNVVYLINKTKKFLAIIGMLGIIWTSGPMQYLNAMVPNESEYLDSILINETLEDEQYYESDELDIGLVPAISEDVSLRTANEKYFRKLDGTYEVAIYDNVVHYLVDGEWVQIDNSLNDLGNELENNKNKFQVKFPKVIDYNKTIKLSMDDYKIDWSILDISSSDAEYSNNESTSNNIKELNDINQLITYSQVQNGVDVEYLLSGDSIKEFIVLNSYIPDFSMTFEYKLKNLSLVENSDGILVFLDDENSEVFQFDQLFMFDADLSSSYEVEYTLVELGNKTYQVTITPNDEWLQNAVYPVKIDPTLKSSSTSMGIYDTYISEADPNIKYYSSQYMYLSNTYSSAEYRGLLYFSIPSSIMDQVITYAHLSFTEYSTVNGSQINIYKNTESFSSSSATWNNAPSYDTSVVDYHVIDNDNPMIFDITESVKEWQSAGIRVTHGFTIAKDENYGNVNIVYQNGASTSLRPVVTIGYEEPSGLKDYWTYTSQDMGMVGTGYISDYTGNLTWVRNEYSLENEYMSLSLSFFHNNYSRNIDIGYGDGWRNNYSVEVLYDSATSTYYIHKPDGNKVFFMNKSCVTVTTNVAECKYISEDGSRMELSYTEAYGSIGSFKITTISDLEYNFNSNGRLTNIRNTKTDHYLRVYYIDSTSLKIDYVKDEAGNRIDFYYDTSRLSGTALSLIQADATQRMVENRDYYYDDYNNIDYIDYAFRYGTSGHTGFTDDINDKLEYYFDSNNRLIYTYNHKDDFKITYGYDTSGRVDEFLTDDSNYDLSNTSIDYDYLRTTYTDYEGDSIYYTFDNYGHTINILDDYGNSTFYRYSGLFSNVNGLYDEHNGYDLINLEPNYYNNHNLIENSDVKKQHQNPINDHGFEENNDGWNLYEGTGDITYTLDESVLGSKSLKIYRSNSSVYAYQSVYLEAGSYTIEGWIKNSGGSPGAYIDITNTSTKGTIEEVYNATEWIKYQLEFSIDNSGYVEIRLVNDSNYSTAYFDNVQLYEGFVDTRYNAVVNNSFESGTTSWSTNGFSSVYISETGIMEEILGEKSLRAYGDGASLDSFSQDITNLITNGETYVIGGWGKADTVPNKAYFDGSEIASDDRFFGLVLEVVYYKTDVATVPVTMYRYMPFNTTYEDWQYQMMTIEFPDRVDSVTLHGYFRGEGYAYFDNIQLYHDDLSTHYGYNSTTGNLITISDPSGSTTTFGYDTENNVTSVDVDGQTTTIDRNNTYQIEEVSKNNVRTTFIYDSTTKQMTDTIVGDQNSYWFGTSTTHTTDGQYIDSVTDEFGNTSTSTVDQTIGTVWKIMDEIGNYQWFAYDEYGNVLHTYALDATTGASVLPYITSSYSYDDQGRLWKINRDGYNYEFIYNDLDQIIEVKIANVSVMEYDYWEEVEGTDIYYTDKLKKQTYGNGDYVEFTYTEENLVKTISFNGIIRYEYDYDSSGRLSILKDIHNDNIYFYSYDLAGRLEVITDKDGNEITYSYDDQGNVDQYYYNISGITRGVTYKYDATTGEYKYTQYNVGSTTVKKDFSYDNDSLRRLDSIDLVIGSFTLTKAFTYDDSKVTNGNATNRIYRIDYYYNSSYPTRYYYEYDENHNITEIKVTNPYGTVIDQYNYHYDGFNQLIREDIKIDQTNVKSVENVYDDQGNITGIYDFNYTNPTLSITSSPNYQKVMTYGNTWGDQITQISYYNGVTLDYTEIYSYDSSGNLTAINDSRSAYDDTFVWDGRQLTNFGSYCFGYSYKYNDIGMRTEKNFSSCGGSLSIDYTLDGDKVLVEERSDGTTLYFTYDIDGTLLSMNYNGTEYFYVTNMQGDIIELLDSSGSVVVKYKYDAWGNIVYKTNDPLADINPYRYRGYRFDEETGWYYLQSRYYNPNVGRFISVDGLLGEEGYITSHNMYSYAINNPAMISYTLGNDSVYFIESNSLVATSEFSNSISLERAYGNVYAFAKKRPNFKPRKPSRKGSENRRPTGLRERNIGHKDAEEHSRRPKGNNGLRRIVPAVGALASVAFESKKDEIALFLIYFGATATAVLIADDVTGIGVADDPLILVTASIFLVGLILYEGDEEIEVIIGNETIIE